VSVLSGEVQITKQRHARPNLTDELVLVADMKGQISLFKFEREDKQIRKGLVFNE
jgi:ssDNA-binding replication factor A large subunit